ncbi:hypothetical protein [Chitinophaga rhizosphaerae]|uniref:hypothetical protein n=1 Tax=Chitinophaga rhizosphaerae TaxID=1864947 RepID=UPI000F802899|nr:hypothetical protein [Chitinophaga rhizosphaerae]
MKYCIFLLMIVAAGCGSANGSQQNTDSTALNADSLATADARARAEAFLQLFPSVNPNDLAIASPQTDSNGVMKGMVGKWLDSSMVKFLPDNWAEGEIGVPGELYGGYFAVGKFAMGDYEMLLLRAPGEYQSSRIQLLAWHKPTARVKDHIMLADEWGDAGDAQQTYSWLHPDGKELEVRMAVLSSYQDPEDSTGRSESSADYAIFRFRNDVFDTTGMKQRRNEAFFRSKFKDSYQVPDSVYVAYHPNSNADSHE